MFGDFKFKVVSFLICFFLSSSSFAYWPFAEEKKEKPMTLEMMICRQYFAWTGMPCEIIEKSLYEYYEASNYIYVKRLEAEFYVYAKKLEAEFIKNFL